MSDNKSLSYKDAGVDIHAGNELVKRIKEDVKQTQRPEVMGGLGGFGALCSIPSRYKEPVLVSGTDGVGTKLRLAIDFNRHSSIGIDLVAMCANDLIVQGAEPLFFLDYYATAKLDVEVASSVIKGIAEGCKQSNCALVGGETAEMPGMYHQGDYNLAGFCVGVVEKEDIIDGSQVKAGDTIIALASSGPHSNGYSLIRKVLDVNNIDAGKELLEGVPLIEHLLSPTKLYVQSTLKTIAKVNVHGLCHITGGGFWENIPRILPDSTQAVIDKSSWQWPSIFSWIQKHGNISDYEMYRTFNCGVGMLLIVSASDASQALSILKENGEDAWIIGSIHESVNDSVVIR